MTTCIYYVVRLLIVFRRRQYF